MAMYHCIDAKVVSRRILYWLMQSGLSVQRAIEGSNFSNTQMDHKACATDTRLQHLMFT